ncbi:hypothetical protein BsWGS_17951 [Bradybaena similaris]
MAAFTKLRIFKWRMNYTFKLNTYQYSTNSIRYILSNKKTDQVICVKGWVKSVQHHKGVTFLHVNDGSGPQNIQVVIPPSVAEAAEVTFGSCVEVQGVLKESPAKGQSVELLSTSVNVIGPCNPHEFPLKQRTRHPVQYTRDFLHLRPKTNVFSALLRIRNVASMAVHSFFQRDGYTFIHTPILTSCDCEGACEVFTVEPLKNILTSSDSASSDTNVIECGPNKNSFGDNSNQSPGQEDLKCNHFFKQPSFLTVSGQLHLEVMTGAFTKVYNFGPVFRAEDSHSSYHLSEFYMVEAELAFIDELENLMNVMEELVKFVCRSVIEKCSEDVDAFLKNTESSKSLASLNKMIEHNFARLTYADAIQILENSKENFQFEVFWGCDLKKEHEIHLTKAAGNIPVFVTDYPAHIKPFYSRRNDDTITVAASDLLVPDVGELCGSSLREERIDILTEVMTNKGLINQMPWYLELRKFGSCPHGGFGLGFERLLMTLLGAHSLKDVIPFPRWPGKCAL